MAVNNSTPNKAPVSAVPQKKKEGSGFVNFDRAAQENQQASQALGSKINTGINQQVQAAQGQVQGQVQNVQGQVQQENQRLASATGQILGQPATGIAPINSVQGTGQVQPVNPQPGGVVGQIQNDPTQVNKQQYQDLTSGRINKADTTELSSSQGKLGSTANVAKQLSTSPEARQQAIQQTANRPLAMQNLNSLQKNLDSMLLGRNVDTQQIGNKAARASFNLDRTVNKEVGEATKAATQQQTQATQNQNILRGARQQAVSAQQKAAQEAADKFNAETKDYLDYLNSDQINALLGSQGIVTGNKLKLDEPVQQVKVSEGTPSKEEAARNRFLSELQSQGIDPNELDITDLGTSGALNLIRQGEYGAPITAEQALNDSQRARLKALYGLEDELQGKDYLNEQYKAPTAGVKLDALKDAAAKSAANTAAARQRYEQGVNLLNSQYDKVVNNPDADLSGLFEQITPEFNQKVLARANEIQPLTYDSATNNIILQQARREVAQSLAKSPEGRKAVLSSMEEAARQGFDRSGTIDQIGEYLYKQDLGTNSGWARAMDEVRNAFMPYVQRKVLTLSGASKDPNLAGGAYTGPGLQGVRQSSNGFADNLGNVIRNVSGGLSYGTLPQAYDTLTKK